MSVLSKGAGDAGMLLKTVSKPIKPLSACPDSPCAQATPASPAPSSPAPASAASGAVNLSGNPMVDMMSVFSMMYGASGVASTPLGLVLNANTAMTVISGARQPLSRVSRCWQRRARGVAAQLQCSTGVRDSLAAACVLCTCCCQLSAASAPHGPLERAQKACKCAQTPHV